MHRLAIGLLGLSVVVASAVTAIVFAYLATDEVGLDWLVTALVVIAVAAPLYGTVATLHSARPLPLILGIALAAAALLWLSTLADVPLELPERVSRVSYAAPMMAGMEESYCRSIRGGDPASSGDLCNDAVMTDNTDSHGPAATPAQAGRAPTRLPIGRAQAIPSWPRPMGRRRRTATPAVRTRRSRPSWASSLSCTTSGARSPRT
jgi:hypothetical protein